MLLFLNAFDSDIFFLLRLDAKWISQFIGPALFKTHIYTGRYQVSIRLLLECFENCGSTSRRS